MAIAADHVVLIHYTLTDDDGNVLDTSRERGEPLPYLQGHGNIVPGLERQIAEHSVGDSFIAHVPPAEGYGESAGVPPQAVPRSAFPADFMPQVGMQLAVQDEHGQPLPVWVAKVEGDQVFIDMNHPLAGKTLHFDVEIVRTRAATADELTHGHPHGPDGTAGHHH